MSRHSARRFTWVLTAVVLLLHLTLALEAQTVPLETNNALDFGGSEAYVTFGNASQLGLPRFTLELWFMRVGPGSAAGTGIGGVLAIPLVTKGRGEVDGNNKDMNYFLGIRNADNVLVADFEEGGAGSVPGLNHPVIGVTPVINGVWYHAAATYDGSMWQLFLNWVLEAELIVGEPPRRGA